MTPPKLTGCCRCSLKTGTILIGSLSLASSVLLALLAIVMLEVLDQASPGWSDGTDLSNMLLGELTSYWQTRAKPGAALQTPL